MPIIVLSIVKYRHFFAGQQHHGETARYDESISTTISPPGNVVTQP
ncbi:MAG TPA: hypothetical protein VMU17_03490 [Elusimicrobiota bacterium]|nr:hypothetical protein [Elusimicrobiota bacterium]